MISAAAAPIFSRILHRLQFQRAAAATAQRAQQQRRRNKRKRNSSVKPHHIPPMSATGRMGPARVNERRLPAGYCGNGTENPPNGRQTFFLSYHTRRRGRKRADGTLQ